MQASAPSCSESSAVIRADPAKPPMLNSAWKPDISGRPASRSTSTAWMFMATSMEPSAAPKANRASASVAGEPRSPAGAGPAQTEPARNDDRLAAVARAHDSGQKHRDDRADAEAEQ